ncbi:sensor histidine kinase [Streptomyces adelaidensis]|uniref:sensor histidine kinase n=1 Tax=Streptomyces adelaidensis TaxID=2796465 RepID=UPI00190678AA|nr:HAMP domain-containing sensor histidine kinase [Streptomyces adelaidensis]
MKRWTRRAQLRSLRARLVLGTTLLATAAVLLCQAAGLTVLRTWLTDQTDGRLIRFQSVPLSPDAVGGGASPGGPGGADVLPSDYRVFFYDPSGRKLSASLGGDDEEGAGPRLPRRESSLGLENGHPETLPSTDGSSHWRVIARARDDGTRVVVALPMNAVDGATSKMLWFSLIIGGVVAVGVVLFGNVVVRVGLRPLARVERTARRIADGEVELSVPDRHVVTEVGHLSRALNTMLDRLRAALHRTETSEQRLRSFLADAGHELRTPLTTLQGFAELLVQEPEMTTGQRQEAHLLIVRNAERMSRLVDSLFQLAKLSDAPLMHREPVDLLSLAADSITAVAVRHPGRTIGLGALTDQQGSFEAELDVVETYGDPYQLAQILTNLLGNACAHTPPGVRIQARVGTLRVRPCGEGTDRPGRTSVNPPLRVGTRVCAVEVTDEGPGLDAADARRVFERFYRADSVRGSASGSGLGLAIASAIAVAHGGRLELDTGPGEGCTFRLLLPHETDTAAPEPAGREDVPDARPASGRPAAAVGPRVNADAPENEEQGKELGHWLSGAVPWDAADPV